MLSDKEPSWGEVNMATVAFYGSRNIDDILRWEGMTTGVLRLTSLVLIVAETKQCYSNIPNPTLPNKSPLIWNNNSPSTLPWKCSRRLIVAPPVAASVIRDVLTTNQTESDTVLTGRLILRPDSEQVINWLSCWRTNGLPIKAWDGECECGCWIWAPTSVLWQKNNNDGIFIGGNWCGTEKNVSKNGVNRRLISSPDDNREAILDNHHSSRCIEGLIVIAYYLQIVRFAWPLEMPHTLIKGYWIYI